MLEGWNAYQTSSAAAARTLMRRNRCNTTIPDSFLEIFCFHTKFEHLEGLRESLHQDQLKYHNGPKGLSVLDQCSMITWELTN